MDETGSLSTGGLIWSDNAWEQLLGRNTEDFVAESVHELRSLEQRMLFLRLSMLIGWSVEAGKLAVCRLHEL